MKAPTIGYIAESGYQHWFPIEAMQHVLPGPLFTRDPRFAKRTNAVLVDDSFASAIAKSGVDIVCSTSQRIHPNALREENPQLKVVFINHGESHKTHNENGERSFSHASINDDFDLLCVASYPHLAD
ncbi:MAG: hypothetical protein AAF645_08020, partial [Myxococcota bacterium]